MHWRLQATDERGAFYISEFNAVSLYELQDYLADFLRGAGYSYIDTIEITTRKDITDETGNDVRQ